jgi:hypothetical protein
MKECQTALSTLCPIPLHENKRLENIYKTAQVKTQLAKKTHKDKHNASHKLHNKKLKLSSNDVGADSNGVDPSITIDLKSQLEINESIPNVSVTEVKESPLQNISETVSTQLSISETETKESRLPKRKVALLVPLLLIYR